MIELYQLDKNLQFPHPDYALDDPNGLLAFGGDLSVQRLVLAYRNGIFPWFSENEPLLWWSPNPRGVLDFSDFNCSKSLKKFIRKTSLVVTVNKAFEQVTWACAQVPRADNGTWITREMLDAYQQLHKAGHAHSIEVWQDDELVGGLYGVAVGAVFCGESMFHKSTNASKLAFYHLVHHLQNNGFAFIDCQMQNPHLQTLGIKEISRGEYLEKLTKFRDELPAEYTWQVQELTV